MSVHELSDKIPQYEGKGTEKFLKLNKSLLFNVSSERSATSRVGLVGNGFLF